MLAGASFGLGSKFDILNGPGWLGYIDSIRFKPFEMKRNNFANQLLNFRDRSASCNTAWETWHIDREVFTCLLNDHRILYRCSEPLKPACFRILISAPSVSSANGLPAIVTLACIFEYLN